MSRLLGSGVRLALRYSCSGPWCPLYLTLALNPAITQPVHCFQEVWFRTSAEISLALTWVVTRRSLPQMLRYLLTERPGDRGAAADAGLLPRLAALLGSGEHPDVTEAALGLASVYAQPPEQVHYLRQVR